MKTSKDHGFTLVETLVAVGLFAIVTTIASSAFLAMINADRVSRSVRIATDNLSLALEDMSRRIKTGTTYACGGGNGTQDCPLASGGGGSLAFYDQNGPRIGYKRGVGSDCGSLYTATQGCVLRQSVSASSVSPWTPTTSHEIDIINLKFVVGGSSSADAIQPYVVISIEGSIGTPPKPVTKFKMQTMVTERQLDL